MLRVNVDSAEEGAREGLDKSLSWQQSLAVGIGVALFTIVVLKQLSQTENSSAQQESSEEIAVVTGDTALIDAVDKKLAESLSLFKQHHQDKAVALTEDVLALAKTTENQDRQGELLQRIAVTQADQDALVLVKLTIKELFRLSDHIYTRIAMAKSYIRQQALPEARLEAKAAWQAFQQLAVADKTAALLADLLMVRVDLGAEGVKGFVALDSLADKSLQSQALLMVAEQLHAIQKRPDKMMSMLEGAFVTAAKVDDPFYRMTLMTAALVKRAELDKPEGIAVLLSRIPAATQKSRIWLAMAKSYRRSGKEKTAQQAFQKALTLASPGQRVIIEKVLNP
jgi:tetratricopeptide (TPR) repeat protein